MYLESRAIYHGCTNGNNNIINNNNSSNDNDNRLKTNLTARMFTHNAAISMLKAALKMNGREDHRAAVSLSI